VVVVVAVVLERQDVVGGHASTSRRTTVGLPDPEPLATPMTTE
jgi:hypothetical protein